MTGENMTAGQKLKKQLKERGYTQTELAEIIGVEPNQIQRLCNTDHKEPAVPLSVWFNLSEVFGVPLEYWAPDDLFADIEQTRLSIKALDVEKQLKRQQRLYYGRMKRAGRKDG